MSIAWVLRHPEMTSALIGASRTSQIDDAVGALSHLQFEPGELQAIEQVLA
jgi:L-glyceraldehyde 3-phosphate reductase